MQDIHSIGGGRLFSGGGGGGGDRRLRPQQHQNQQALKCPRCDSLNTKFCYYNNYNLSQPRHFCKSCRRYWTKGGVLRNVPVGGGCRKTKRSKPKQTTTIDNITTTAPTPATATTTNTNTNSTLAQEGERKSSNSHSSSESSSLTATGNNSTGLEAVSAHSSSSATNSVLNGIGESKLFVHPNMNNNNNKNNNNSFEHGGLLEQGSDCGIFSEIASFTSLITSSSSNDHSLQFGFGNIIMNQQHHTLDHQNNNNNHQWHQQQKLMSTGGGDHQDFKMEDMAAGGGGGGGGLINVDQTVHVDLSALHNNNSRSGNIGPLDWQASGTGVDQGLFDLPNAVDQNYWNQSQWSTDHDQTSLYLP